MSNANSLSFGPPCGVGQSGPRPARYFTVNEVGARWGVKHGFVRDRIADGALRAYKFGGVLRVAEPDLWQYEAASVVIPTDALVARTSGRQ